MSNSSVEKKPAQGWHRADVIAALRKAGWSLRQLSLAHGLSQSALHKAFAGPYPKAERLVAEAIGVQPMEIWPSRYDAKGKPNRLGSRRPMRPDIGVKRSADGHRGASQQAVGGR
jgi:Ner family transcriptional regulator